LDGFTLCHGAEDTTLKNASIKFATQILVLDDFGLRNATGWAQEKLFQNCNYDYITKLSTVHDQFGIG